MNDQALITTIDSSGVARLTMNRLDVMNAFNEEVVEEICEAMGHYHKDDNVRAIVLTGAGKVFSAGADLNMMQRAASSTSAQNQDDARRMAHMLHAIYTAPKPTVALVNGPAMGGGLGLIAACDIAIGVEEAFFALSEVRLGLIPAVISPFVVEAIGARQARRYFLTGERFNAETARKIGLLHIVAPAASIADELDKLLGRLLAGAPLAQNEAKELIRAVTHGGVNERVMDDTAGRIARLRASPEGKEGVASFLEKRKPAWVKGD